MPNGKETLGCWQGGAVGPHFGADALAQAFRELNQPFWVVWKGSEIGVAFDGSVSLNPNQKTTSGDISVVAFVPALRPNVLGDAGFLADHGLRFPYVAGAMANGIGSADIVEAMAKAGMLGFFGAAGLTLDRVTREIDRITTNLAGLAYGFNLIHSPNEQDLEWGVADLYLRRGIRLIEASAYLDLTLPVVRYRTQGIRRRSDGSIETPNRIVAKVSRVEVASKFWAPPPERHLKELVARGDLTAEQADLARQIPMAQDITAEADSGGHTDNRPAITLLPTLLALRDKMESRYEGRFRLRVGLGGGIATPLSVSAAFSMGAAYVVTGSINQACVESGSSDLVRQMLAEAGQADTAMAPAADMFEMGVKVQVLKRGTLFAVRGGKLFELYRSYNSLEEIPAAERTSLEQNLFRASLDEIWRQTEQYFAVRDPRQNERANRDPKHKMALVFRWYLGQASRWANQGDASRKIDYQVWCGPAMGAFNEWVSGSFLQQPANRKVVTVAYNLLYGAAVLTRVRMARLQGAALPASFDSIAPLELESLKARMIH